ncbi:MAG: hypothetical protein Q8K63_10525, partial [Acidimicrobiales bacterium]|nr:hypothetical protein [Acidimicrobiales bacterium]
GRELGFRQAAAPVVAFTDDDCVQSVTWLAAGLRALGERRAIVVGCTMPNPDQAANRGQFSRTLQVRNTLYFQTCNIFYRLADLEAVGGFDAGFDKPGGEDTDLALRMIDELGVEAVFAEEALVYHDISPSDFRACVRVANRWTGVARLIAKHPSTRKTFLYQRVFWKITHQRVLLAWLGLVGAIFDARTLVLVVPWLWYRARKRQSGLRVRPHAVPGRFIIDTVEVVTMIRGSVRERTFIL